MTRQTLWDGAGNPWHRAVELPADFAAVGDQLPVRYGALSLRVPPVLVSWLRHEAKRRRVTMVSVRDEHIEAVTVVPAVSK